ncbi:MAG: hypothetical protein GWP04_09415 [Gammaproteobacteria bacterium]|nr:hypothetical protein [Gammaproteobacteria bacterium]
MEFTLLGAALLGVAAMLATLRIERLRGTTNRKDLMDIALGTAAIGLAVGRVATMVLQGTNPFTHPLDLFFIRGGVDTGFAALGSMAYLAWAVRHDFWPTLDLLAPAGIAGLGGWHAGCLLRSACAGTTTSLPWAITLAQSPIGRHPVEIYAGLLLFAGAGVLIAVRAKAAPGVIASAALVIAAGVRLATEPLRLGLGADPSPWYATGVMVGLISFSIRVIAARSRNILDS